MSDADRKKCEDTYLGALEYLEDHEGVARKALVERGLEPPEVLIDAVGTDAAVTFAVLVMLVCARMEGN